MCCMLACEHTGGWRRSDAYYITFHTYSLGQGLSMNWKLPFSGRLTSQKVLAFSHLHPSMLHRNTQPSSAFTWVLGIQTQTLIHIEHELLPTEPSTQPLERSLTWNVERRDDAAPSEIRIRNPCTHMGFTTSRVCNLYTYTHKRKSR